MVTMLTGPLNLLKNKNVVNTLRTVMLCWQGILFLEIYYNCFKIINLKNTTYIVKLIIFAPFF